MSKVTNAILHMGCLNDEAGEDTALLEAVNLAFGPDGPLSTQMGFVLIDSEDVGGSKNLECTLAIGAFNYLDLDKLIAHLRTVPWPSDQRDLVQLIVKEQDDDAFGIIWVNADEEAA